MDQVRNGTAELRGEEARHLSRVLRVEPGQKYEISDSRSAWLAEIAEARGDQVVFRVLEPVASPEPPVHVTLLAALIKFDRFEWMVEKATELGVERILPIEAARTEKGLFEAAGKRSRRWERIVREASQQSRRLRAPEIGVAERFEAAITEPADYRFLLDQEATPPLFRSLPPSSPPAQRVALLVGPEGGWTAAERLAAARAGWSPVSLGPTVLRAETAAAAALAIVINSWCS